MSFLPCPSCARHVRAQTPACPFCATPLPTTFGQGAVRAWPTQRLGRAATFKIGAAAVAGAATLLGCGDDDGSTMALYGGPPADGSTPIDTGARDMATTPDTGGGEVDMGTEPADAGPTDMGMMALYGGPPVDGGPMIDDGGGPAPLYGGPPTDAGPTIDDGGGPAPLYGAVPFDAGEAQDAATDDGGIAALYGAVPADP